MPDYSEIRALFEEKGAPVIVAHPTNSLRGQIVSTLKALGFKTVHGGNEIADVVRIISDEVPQDQPVWVLTALFGEEKSNALQLGQLIRKNPEFSRVVWSLILSTEDEYAIPSAIEDGLLSWHAADQFSSADMIRNEIGVLSDLLTRLDYNADFVTLYYTRLHLRNAKAHDRLLKLTTAMVELVPGSGEFLYFLADALALNGQISSAKATATKAVWADQTLLSRLANLTDRDNNPVFTSDEVAAIEQSSHSVLGAFGIARAVIVDPDEAARSHMRAAIEGLGIKDIIEFEDGQTAWDHIQHQHANTILITEWKLPKLSGMSMLQRMYQAGIHDMPVIISSAQLGTQDRGLLEELGSAILLEKPLTQESLDSHIRVAVREENLPSTFKALIRKVRSLLRQNDLNAAKKLWGTGTQEMLVPGIQRKIMAAEILFAEAKLEQAYVNGIAAHKMGAHGAYFLNLLGKIAFALGDFDSAAEWFEKANREVEINIDRLTDMAAVELNRGDTQKASEVAEKAEKLDSENPKVIETMAMVALEKGDTGAASAMMAQLNDLMNIVAHLNNRAVALAWKGEHDKGILLYREALSAAPGGTSNTAKSFTPFVVYNLALALARKGALEAAEKVITGLDLRALASQDSRLAAKVGAFHKRVNMAIKSGSTMVIDIPKTSELARKRIQKLINTADAGRVKAINLLKELNVLGSIDFRAQKMVEKSLRSHAKKI